jgi:ribulose 1,5-bisphosphate synthetase/thiazole synthase
LRGHADDEHFALKTAKTLKTTKTTRNVQGKVLPMQLKDVAVLITGGGSGLGAATARAMATKGAKIAVLDQSRKMPRRSRPK